MQALKQGSQATLRLGTYKSSERVAVKVFPATAKGKSDFEREVTTYSYARSNTRCVTMKDYFISSGQGMIIMELVPGGDLFDVIRNQQQVSLYNTMKYFKELCIAVQECHNSGFAHLDLKPENILVSRTPRGTPGVRLCDFGMSEIGLEKTIQGIRGTVNYAAPEVLSGKSYFPAPADIWSLGVTLHVMLTKCYPSLPTLDLNCLSDPTERTVCADLITKMLYKDPDSRLTIDQVLNHPIFSLVEQKRIAPLSRSHSAQASLSSPRSCDPSLGPGIKLREGKRRKLLRKLKKICKI